MKRLCILWILSICLLPFMQGGYFYFEMFGFGVVQGIVLILLIIINKHNLSWYGFRAFYLLLFLSSLISSISSVDLGMQVFGILKFIIILLFIINLDSFYGYYKENLKNYILESIVLSSSLLTFVTFFILLVLPEDHSFFLHMIQGSRVGSFFQYANVFGIYLFGSLLLLYSLHVKPFLKYAIGCLFVAGITLSQSRGALLLTMLVLLLMIVFNYNKMRRLYFISATGFFLGQITLLNLKDSVESFRGVQLSQNSSEWLSRLLYYEDGLTILKNNLIGYGNLGYSYVQGYFQTGASYKVKYIHSSLLQLGIDFGIVAAIVFIALIIYIFKNHFTFITQSNQRNTISTNVLLMGMLGMFIHSLIDFDFQFFAFEVLFIIYIFWIEKGFVTKENHPKMWTKWPILLITSAVTIVCVYMFGVTFLEYNQEDEKAYLLYPYYTDAVEDMLKVHNFEDPKKERKKVAMALKATKENSYLVSGFAFLRDYYYNSGDFILAVDNATKVYQLVPLRLDYYEVYLKITFRYLMELDANGTLTKEHVQLQQLLDMDNYLKELEIKRKNSYTIKHQVDFTKTSTMESIQKKAKELYDKLEQEQNNTI